MLQQQTVAIDFTEGLDKKSDEKLVLAGQLTRAENTGFDGPNTLSKDGGYTQLASNAVVGGGTITEANNAVTVADELVVQADGKLYALSTNGLQERGTAQGVAVTKRAVVRNGATQSGFDCAVAGKYEVHAWQDSRGGVRACVRDARGMFVVPDTQLSASGVLPRCLSDGATVYVLYLEGTNLQMRTLSSGTPTAFSSAVTVITNAANSAQQMDAVIDRSGIYVAYRSTTNQLEVRKVSTSGTVQASRTVAENPNRGLGVVWLSTSSRLLVFDHEPTSGNFNVRALDTSLTVAAGPTTVAIKTSGFYPRITGLELASGDCRVFYEDTAASAINTKVNAATITSACVVSSGPSVFARSVGLASAPFSINGATVLAVAYEGGSPAMQPTVFVVDTDSSISPPPVRARVAAGNGGGLLSAARVPNAPTLSDGSIALPVNERGRLTVETSGGGSAIIDRTPEGISVAKLEADASLPSLPVGDLLFLCGAVPSFYDGVGTVEAGFHLFPEGLSVTASAGGALSAGTYACVAVYEWLDAKGRWIPSAASPAVQVVAAANDQFTWTIPTLRLTDKHSGNGRANVRIVPYRTEADGSIYYRVAAPEDAPENDTTADTVSFTDDTMADATLISGQPLYSQVALDAGPLPPCRAAGIHRNRLVLVGLEDADKVAISLNLRDGEQPRFNEALRYPVPTEGGALESVFSMDGRLYAQREGRTFAWDGEPPNDAGGGSDLGEPRVVLPDIGCVNARSLVETPAGWAFESEKGIYALGHGEQLQFLGAPVDTISGDSTAALMLRAQNKTRWYTSGGTVLVFDWTRGKWTTLTNHAAAGAAEWLEGIVRVSPTGYLYLDGGYDHAGTAISQVLETGWLKVAGLNGFQRVWEALFLGEMYSPGTVTVDVAFDYSPTYTETFTVDTSALFGASEAVLELRHHLSRQKCSAIRFRITEAAVGRGMRLTEMALLVGIKKGGRKLPATYTV